MSSGETPINLPIRRLRAAPHWPERKPVKNDDLTWLNNAQRWGGSFISAFATAALRADEGNYQLLQPVVAELKKKYPDYDRDEMSRL